jgi:hypothetical protein
VRTARVLVWAGVGIGLLGTLSSRTGTDELRLKEEGKSQK